MTNKAKELIDNAHRYFNPGSKSEVKDAYERAWRSANMAIENERRIADMRVKQASMPHWIAVSKRLPRPGVKVPVACLEEGMPTNGNLALASGLVNEVGEWFFDGDAKVTPVYWQEVELPTLNEEDL